MVLQNGQFFKLTIWIKGKRFVYYGNGSEYLAFNEKLKHEIIWTKKSNVNSVKAQPTLF